MSELKAISSGEIYNIIEYEGSCITDNLYYPKSDADKVIAELKEQYKDMDVTHTVHIAKMNAKIEELEDNVDFWKKKLDDEMASRRDEYEKPEKEIRHHKYKRCLAMARRCEERYNYLTCLENWQMTDREFQQVIGGYWDRWCNRWLKLADNFKE